MNDIIRTKLKEMPSGSGVYIMRNADGEIVYIGKAVNLKNRVRSYFHDSIKDSKVMALIDKVADFDYIITNSEVDALVLENTLIKHHKPHYNILLKDDKLYPFLRIDTRESFPKIEVIRRLKSDGAKYFGPYMLGITTRDMLDMLHTAFSLRSCSHNLCKLAKSHRACLNYHIGRCSAPCKGLISREEYRKVIGEVIDFLKGDDKKVRQILNQKMQACSDKLDFETAMEYKKRLDVLDKMVRSQVVALPKDYNLDVFGIATGIASNAIAVLSVRGGKLVSADKYPVKAGLDNSDSLSSFIYQYYGFTPIIAEEIICSINLDGAGLEEALTQKAGKKIRVSTPRQGVRRQLTIMADNNAEEYLSRSTADLTRRENMTSGAAVQLGQILGIATPIRMECYDISNISGTDKAASMTVFCTGEKDTKMYRTFRIKTVTGANDFASIKEALSRRLNRLTEGKDISFRQRPDLIVIDGGHGQVTYAMEALSECGYPDIPLIGLAKRDETIIKADGQEVQLPKNSFALMLLQRIRDEAHRFAVNYHRKLRAARTLESKLKAIDGVGESTVKALFAHFKSYEAIARADRDALLQVPRLSAKQADSIIRFFSDTASSGN